MKPAHRVSYSLSCSLPPMATVAGSPAPSTIVMYNDMSHLPSDLRWTGFPDAIRP